MKCSHGNHEFDVSQSACTAKSMGDDPCISTNESVSQGDVHFTRGWLSRDRQRGDRIILQTELFAYNPQSPLDDSWFRSYCSHLCELDDKHFRAECLVAVTRALRNLKPRYSVGPLGAGGITGDLPQSLRECLEVIRSLDRHAAVKPDEPPNLAEDWLLHLESDIDHFTEIAESIDNGTNLLRKLNLDEMRLIFCYLPDSYEEQNRRDTEYQRPLFASNSLMQQVLQRR